MANSIYLAKVGTLQTARVDFVEDATSTSYTAMVPIPAGAVLMEIAAMGRADWAGTTPTLDIGDTADPNGYVAAASLVAADEFVFPFYVSSLGYGNEFADHYGAYYVSSTDRTLVGPAVNNFGWDYVAGSNLIIKVNVATPNATPTGRTTVVVYYTVPASIPIVSA